MVIYFPFALWGFLESLAKPSKLIEEAEIIELPLVNRSEERFYKRKGLYQCYVEFPKGIYNYYRRDNPRSIDSISIYSHPHLTPVNIVEATIIEVPENPTWETVYLNMSGEKVSWSILKLIGKLLGTILTSYIAVRGFWAIKGGRPTRKRKRRR